MRFTRKIFIPALLAGLLGGAAAYAAEFEVLDRFSVDGYTVLRGSADIPGGSFAVGGSAFVVKAGNVGIGTAAPGASLDVNGSLLISAAHATIKHAVRTVQNGGLSIGTYYVKLFDNSSDTSPRLSFKMTSASGSEYGAEVDVFIPSYVYYSPDSYGGWTNGIGPQITTRMGGLNGQAATFKNIHAVSAGTGDLQLWLEFYTDYTTRVISLSENPGSGAVTWAGLTTSAPANIRKSVAFAAGAKNENGIVSRFDGNVGIGTTAPSAGVLTVFGGGNILALQKTGDAAALAFGGAANAAALIESKTGGGFTFYTGGSGTWTSPAWTPQLTILNSGNLGIGTAAPGYKLEVNGAGFINGNLNTANTLAYGRAIISTSETKNNSTPTAASSALFLSTNETDTPFGIKFQVVGNAAAASRYISMQTGEHNVANNGNLALQPAGGNVGIGTLTPGSKLEVAGSYANSGAYATTYHLDTTPAGILVANGGTIDIPNFSGMVIVNNWTNGSVTTYLCGGGSTAAIGSVGGQVGTMVYVSAIAGYRWTNNYGAPAMIGMAIFRTRPTA